MYIAQKSIGKKFNYTMIEYMNKKTINNTYILSLILFMSVNAMNSSINSKEDMRDNSPFTSHTEQCEDSTLSRYIIHEISAIPLDEDTLAVKKSFCDNARDILNQFMQKHSISNNFETENIPSQDICVNLALPILMQIIDKLESITDRSEYNHRIIVPRARGCFIYIPYYYRLKNFEPMLNPFPFNNFEGQQIPPISEEYKLRYTDTLKSLTLEFPIYETTEVHTEHSAQYTRGISEEVKNHQTSVTLFKNGEFKVNTRIR